ncbi:MAG TPA: hypothetical protein VJ820_16170 [Propionibacteriaceae bacterium]|nr:hypothetical protein [Propionibacteriaceae bacterium]
MNNKLAKASIAGVAAIALAATGSTFASWSDFGSLTGSHAGADELSLVLGEPNSQNFDDLHLAPGVGADFEFVVASRQGDTIPAADLRMQLTNLVGHEDGCTSTNSELVDDADCNDTATSGEFVRDARMIVNASEPTTDPQACSSAHPRGARQGLISLSDFSNATASTPINLLPAGTYLAPGEYVCVSMGIVLPKDANNASQGDSADFDLKFLLDQAFPPAP